MSKLDNEINPACPAPGSVISPLADIPENGAKVFDFAKGAARFSIIVTYADGIVAAFENVCPHAGWPLERPDGKIVLDDARYVICAGHAASFRLTDGACVAGPARRGLRPIPVSVANRLIYLGETNEPPHSS